LVGSIQSARCQVACWQEGLYIYRALLKKSPMYIGVFFAKCDLGVSSSLLCVVTAEEAMGRKGGGDLHCAGHAEGAATGGKYMMSHGSCMKSRHTFKEPCGDGRGHTVCALECRADGDICTLCLIFCLSCIRARHVARSLFITHTNTHTHAHTLFGGISVGLTGIFALFVLFSVSRAFARAMWLAHSLSHTQTHIHTHTHFLEKSVWG